MSKHETPLTRAYWEAVGGTLYEEFAAVPTVRGVQSARYLDGVIVLGGSKRLAGRGEAGSLNGKDVLVVQTKATRLNPYIFGQALLSADLIQQRWRPRSLRSVLLCVQDDPELHSVVAAYPQVEVCIVEGRLGSMSLPRRPADVASLVQRLGKAALVNAPVTSRLRLEALVVESGPAMESIAEVSGRGIVTVHSYKDSLGMWVAGEVVVVQTLLLQRGARSVRSIVVVKRGDPAIQGALEKHAKVEIRAVG